MPIIVSRDGQNAQKIAESGVADENYLQRYVSSNPDSLPIEDIKDNVRLMVVGREFDTASGPIDILAVDDDADIYIIETKLFRNPDKRLVISQMLDYGAALWRAYADPAVFVGDLDAFVNRRSSNGLTHALYDVFDLDDEGVEAFIDNLKLALRNGNFRFVVLMDKLHPRLKDLIVFMNQRTAFNIYAVELEFYRHDGLEIVIPKVFGAEAKQAVAEMAGKRRRWDEESFLRELREQHGEEVARIAEEILHWVAPKVARIQWGSGARNGSFAPIVEAEGHSHRLFYFWTTSQWSIWTKLFIGKSRLGEEGRLEDLRQRLNAIPGMDVAPDEMKTWTSERHLSLLAEPEAMVQFKETVEWMIGNLKG
jgi:hypothetical protein